MTTEGSMESCRFRSSHGGASHCRDAAYQEGFCRVHFDCFLKGEILLNGQISEKLSDQARRREINFHGIALSEKVYLSE
jgi:hypothetical protein